MNFYSLLAIVIVLSAVFSYLNFRIIKWPQTIGIMVMSLVTSIAIFAAGSFVPELRSFGNQLLTIDFNQLLMKVMLGFLLFAGSFPIDINSLKKQAPAIFVLAIAGTLLSTFIVGCSAYYLCQWLGLSIPFIYCLLFGSLISPTDPIAVLGILKEAKVPESLESKIAGESLFNDGIAVVIFTTILEIAAAPATAFDMSDTRHAKREKMKTVASNLGVSHTVISQIENGKYRGLNLKLLAKIAHYYKIPLNSLFNSEIVVESGKI